MLGLGYVLLLLMSLMYSLLLFAEIVKSGGNIFDSFFGFFPIPFFLYLGLLLILTRLLQWLPYTKKHLESASPLLRKILQLAVILPPIPTILAIAIELIGNDIINSLGLLFYVGQLLVLPFLILFYALREKKWLDSSIVSMGAMTLTLSTVIYFFLMASCGLEFYENEGHHPESGECDYPLFLLPLMLFGLIQTTLGFRGHKNKKRLLVIAAISAIPALLFWGLWAIIVLINM